MTPSTSTPTSTSSSTPGRLSAVAVLAMTLAGGVARSSTLVSQIIVGNFLTEQEVGTYAIAVGITGFSCMLRGGGVSHYLPTIRPEDYDASTGRVFWWGFWFRLLAAVATLAVALAIPQLDFKETPPRLAETLEVFALSQVLLAFSIVGRMKMAVDLQFPQLARLDVTIAIFRVVATAILAWAGTGPLALVIPIAMAPAVELLYYFINGTMSNVSYRWSGGTVKETAKILLWPAIVSVLLSLNSQLNFLVVKPMLALASMGVFYFAYQLANQPVLLMAGPLSSVLATHFARERGDPRRESLAVIHTTSGAVLFSSLICFLLIAVFPATERLLWGGKWAEANIAVIALTAAGCWATAVSMLGFALAGLQRFKAMAGFEALKGLGIFAGAALGALLASLQQRGDLELPKQLLRDSTLISVATGITVAAMSIGQLVWLLRANRARWLSTARAIAQGPLLGASAAVGAMLGGTVTAEILLEIAPGVSPRLMALVECAATGLSYALFAVAVVRLTSVGALRDAVALIPDRLRPTAQRLLFL
ncbi:MAG: oligosaccharide flippase family protein [Planctomycetaceae bacterium]|nr:oligosaccharide flippase family protein [Planctomycetaceae bacterium]